MPGGRHLCFGRYVADDLMCVECPPYLANKCIRTTPGVVELRAAYDDVLVNLKAKLRGSAP